MAIQRKYTKQSPIIPTFDYVDISDGTGYVDYYGIKVENSTGDVYKLVRQTNIPTDGIYTFSEVDENTNTNFDFEVEYNSTRTLKGKAYFSIPYAYDNQYTGSETVSVTADVYLYHIDTASNATQLGSMITESITSTTGPEIRGDRFTGEIDISDEQVIVPGEKIRLRVNIEVGNSSNANSKGRIYHAPEDGDAWTDEGNIKNHILNLSLPFRIYQ